MNKNDIAYLDRWLARKPEAANTLRVSARQIGSIIPVREHVVADDLAKEDRISLAKEIFDDCSMWTDQSGKETTFLIQWIDDDRPIATQHFRVAPLNDGNGLPVVDGSAESIITCLQAANLQKDQEILKIMNGVSNLLAGQAEILQGSLDQRNSLERENLRLKEALLEKSESADDAEWKKEMLSIVKNFLPLLPKPPNG